MQGRALVNKAVLVFQRSRAGAVDAEEHQARRWPARFDMSSVEVVPLEQVGAMSIAM